MNISLIGMMGSGKTTIGEILSGILKEYSYIDTDSQIVNLKKKSINEIFSDNGENYFRNVESQVLESILEKDNQIISTGGGIIKSEKNIEFLKEKSVVFYLKADEETLYNRIKNNKERPLLNVLGIRQKIRELLAERSNSYEKADYIIITDNKTPQDIANEIIGIINDSCRSKN